MPHINPRRKRATFNSDHRRRTHVPAPADDAIAARLDDLVKPAVYAELDYYRRLGLRSRLLSLPVMMAVLLTLTWRRVSGVSDLTRLLARDRLLWAQPTTVAQPSLSERFLTFPADLVRRIAERVFAQLPERLAARTRPLPPLLKGVLPQFSGCYAIDGSTLEALFRKLKTLQEEPDAPLAGSLTVACDLRNHLPVKLWYEEDALSNGTRLAQPLLDWLPRNALVVFDLGYFAFPFFDKLTAQGGWFVTRLKSKTSYRIETVLLDRPRVRDRIVHLGKYRSNPSTHPVRLVEVYLNGAWRSYLTNVLDPSRLSVVEVVALYGERWQVETVFLETKRLLDLAYLWVGSLNGVQLQVWTTFLFYGVLRDLVDEVAEELKVAAEQVSVEMVYRGLYYYVLARAQGYEGTAAAYLAREAKGLGVLKRERKRPDVMHLVRQALVLPLPPPTLTSEPKA